MSEEETEKAGKVAAQLKKLHVAGAIKDHKDAEFYARFLVIFGATFVGWPAKPQVRENERRK